MHLAAACLNVALDIVFRTCGRLSVESSCQWSRSIGFDQTGSLTVGPMCPSFPYRCWPQAGIEPNHVVAASARCSRRLCLRAPRSSARGREPGVALVKLHSELSEIRICFLALWNRSPSHCDVEGPVGTGTKGPGGMRKIWKSTKAAIRSLLDDSVGARKASVDVPIMAFDAGTPVMGGCRTGPCRRSPVQVQDVFVMAAHGPAPASDVAASAGVPLVHIPRQVVRAPGGRAKRAGRLRRPARRNEGDRRQAAQEDGER